MWYDYLLLVLSAVWLHDICSGPYTTSDRLLVFAWSELCAGYIFARINSDRIARRFSDIVTKAKLAANTKAAEDAAPDPRSYFLVRHLPGRQEEQSIIEWIFALVASFPISGWVGLQAVAPVDNGADTPSPPGEPLQTDGSTSTPPLPPPPPPPPPTEEMLPPHAAELTPEPNGEDETASEEASVGTTEDEETVNQPVEVLEEEEFDEAKELVEMLDTVEEGGEERTGDMRRAMERMMERNRRPRELLAPTKPEEIEAANRAPRSAQTLLVSSTPATGSPVPSIRGTSLRDRRPDAEKETPPGKPISRVLRHRFQRVTRPVDGTTTTTTTTATLDDQHTVRKIDSDAPVDTTVAAAAATNSSSSISSLTEDVTNDDEDATGPATTATIANISSSPTEDIVADNDNDAVKPPAAITNTSGPPSASPLASILITPERRAAGKKDKKNVRPSTPDMPSPRAISFSDRNTVHLYDKRAPPVQRSESSISSIRRTNEDNVNLNYHPSTIADDVVTKSITASNTPSSRGLEEPQLPATSNAPMDVGVDVEVELPIIPIVSTLEESLVWPMSSTVQESPTILPALQAQRTFNELPISSPITSEGIPYPLPMETEPLTEDQSTNEMMVEYRSDPPGLSESHPSENPNFAPSMFIDSQDHNPAGDDKGEMEVENMAIVAHPTPDVEAPAQISLPAEDTFMDESQTMPINTESAVEMSSEVSEPVMDLDMDEKSEIGTLPGLFELSLTEQNEMDISTPAAMTAPTSSAQAPMSTAMTLEDWNRAGALSFGFPVIPKPPLGVDSLFDSETIIPASSTPMNMEETTIPASSTPMNMEETTIPASSTPMNVEETMTPESTNPMAMDETTTPASIPSMTPEDWNKVNALSFGFPVVPKPPPQVNPLSTSETMTTASTSSMTPEDWNRVNALSFGFPVVPKPSLQVDPLSTSETMTTSSTALQSPNLQSSINDVSDPRLKVEPTIQLFNKGEDKAVDDGMEEDFSGIDPENKEYQIAGQGSSSNIYPTNVEKGKRKATEMGGNPEPDEDGGKRKATRMDDLDDGGYEETDQGSSSNIRPTKVDKGKGRATEMDELDDSGYQRAGQSSSSNFPPVEEGKGKRKANDMKESEDDDLEWGDPTSDRGIRAATTSRRSKMSEQQRVPMNITLQDINEPVEAESSSAASKRLMLSSGHDAGQALFATPKNDDLTKLLRQTTRVSRNLPSASTPEVSQEEAAELMKSVSNAFSMPLRPPRLSGRSPSSTSSNLSRPQKTNTKPSSSSTSPMDTGKAKAGKKELSVTSLWPGLTRDEYEDMWLESLHYRKATILRLRDSYCDLKGWHFPPCNPRSFNQNPKPLVIPRSLLAYAEKHFDGLWRQYIEEDGYTAYSVYEMYRKFIESELMAPRDTTRDRW